ncbi:MAG: bacillithiol biosynthesis BshC [Planctomycetota bacterium]|nr:bacillithiol biosynthesis BshC [Planctomycetota bacterium]
MDELTNRLLESLRLREPALTKLLGNIAIDSTEVIENIGHRKPDPQKRRKLLEALKPCWEKLELPPVAREAMALLEDPDTHIVIAGQQPALWGGPLMVVSKALSVTVLARQLERAGIPAVALFWVADDDHDGGELNPGRFHSGKQPGNPHAEGRRPLYDLRHRQLPQDRLAALSDAIGDAPYAREAIRIASAAIASGPAEEFVSLLSQLLPDTPLLPVLPRWFRTLQRPIVERCVQNPGQFRELIVEACREQQSLGIPTPVPAPRDEPVFIIDEDGLRRRPREIRQPLSEILQQDPMSVSPDALLRTIVQDEVIDPSAVILGPTEFCYALQTRKVRQQWGLSRPLWLPRPRLRPIDQEIIDAITAEGIERDEIAPGVAATDLICDPDVKAEAQGITKAGTELIDRIEQLNHRDDASPALQRRARRLVHTWRQQLERLEIAIGRGLGGTAEDRRDHVSRLLEELFPGGLEPERNRNLLDLIAHHGSAVLDQMRRTLQRAAGHWDGSIHPFDLRSEGKTDSNPARQEQREEQHDGQR